MSRKMSKIEELELEKNKMRKLAEIQKTEMKEKFSTAKMETRHIVWEKIVIPAGITLIAGFGAKKLYDWWQSDDENPSYDAANSVSAAVSSDQTIREKKSNSIFGNVDWMGAAVRLLPFVLSVGKKMYDEGNLPFLNGLVDQEEEDI